MSLENEERPRGKDYVLGLDYGSDSARAVLIDAATGETAGVSVRNYPRWAGGLYCDSAANRFRQHPRDYIEVLEETVREVLAGNGALAGKIRGVAIDTTGSTPCAVDGEGTPLALKAEFAENPSAMFVLWKDHTAVAEAEKITRTAKTWGGTDYTRYGGGRLFGGVVLGEGTARYDRRPGRGGGGLFLRGTLRLDERLSYRR
jgi:L-ribulokinase